MKIDIQEIQTVLTELKVPTDLHDKIINQLEQVAEEKKLENQAAKLPSKKMNSALFFSTKPENWPVKNFTPIFTP